MPLTNREILDECDRRIKRDNRLLRMTLPEGVRLAEICALLGLRAATLERFKRGEIDTLPVATWHILAMKVLPQARYGLHNEDGSPTGGGYKRTATSAKDAAADSTDAV